MRIVTGKSASYVGPRGCAAHFAVVNTSSNRASMPPGSSVNDTSANPASVTSTWGFEHKTVCHQAREYAHDEDGDGFHEVHVNTMEVFWSLRRSRLRPHRGISQEHLPLYLGFFEFAHNAKNRGKGLMDSLLGLLLR